MPPEILAVAVNSNRIVVLLFLCILVPSAVYVLAAFVEALWEAHREMRRLRNHGWPIAMRVTSFPLAFGFMFLARLRRAI